MLICDSLCILPPTQGKRLSSQVAARAIWKVNSVPNHFASYILDVFPKDTAERLESFSILS